MKKVRIVLYVMVAAGALTLSSCGLLDSLFGSPPVTKQQCIQNFQAALNASPQVATDIQTNFSPNMQNYSQVASDTVFTSGPLSSADAPFSIDVANASYSGTNDEIVTCSFTNKYDAQGTIVFTMQDYSGDQKILSLSLTIDNNTYTLESLPVR